MTPQRKTNRRSAPPPARKTTRRWRVPPPLIHGTEALECASVLDEVSGGLGALLWQSLRDVMLWSATPAAERAGLFSATAAATRRAALEAVEVPPALAAPLDSLSALLDAAGAKERDTAEACRRVARWAEDSGKLATALAYSQAVALLDPTDASVAFSVAVLARRRAEHARAETWFRRAVMLARQSGDWVSYSLAFTGLGNLYLQRGNFPLARRLHVRARRSARRHGLRAIEGYALHDLFVISSATGQPAEAESFAQAAVEAYGQRHPRLPALAHDVAYYWMERGQFARALPVFQATLPHMPRPSERVRVLANVARAAGGSGRAEVYEEARERALALIGLPGAEEGAAQALLDLARGAASLGRWEQAAEAAARAAEIASTRNQSKVRFEAEAVLDSADRRARVHPAPAGAGEDGAEHPLVASLVDSLAAATAASTA